VERRCIATGASADPESLVRFVLGPDGAVVPDIEERLPGRGLWVTADRAALDHAVAKQLFAKAARRAVKVPPDLVARTEALLTRRCLDLLGLARRGGALITGFDAVAEMLGSGRAAVRLTAAGAGPDGREKLDRRAGALPVVDCLTRGELSLALGKENVVHAALAPGRLSGRFLREARRLGGIRMVPEAVTEGADHSPDRA
jgi:predicted RNA-binding protein YlxR (DUF448 family)